MITGRRSSDRIAGIVKGVGLAYRSIEVQFRGGQGSSGTAVGLQDSYSVGTGVPLLEGKEAEPRNSSFAYIY